MKKISNINGFFPLIIILTIALLSLFGWSIGELLFARFSDLFIPMAPSTALSFVFLILPLIFLLKLKDHKYVKLFSKVFVLAILLMSSIILAKFLFGFSWDLENLFLKNPDSFNEVLIGRMSPLTAGLFILSGISILLMIFIPEKNRIKDNIYGVTVILSLFISTILVIGYIYRAPLLYGMYVVPVALPTAICFWLLSFVLFSYMKFNFLFFINPISSIEKKLTIKLISLALFIVFIFGFFNSIFQQKIENPTILSALLLIITMPISIFVIFFISRNLGKSIYLAEKEIAESEKKFKDIFKYMNEGFALHEIITDDSGKAVDYRYLEVNPAFCKIIGLEIEQIIGKTVREIFPDIVNDPANWIEKFGDVALKGKEITFEDYSQAIGGWFTSHAFSPNKGQFAVTFSDITDRKKASSNLENSENKFRALVEQSLTGIYIFDKDHFLYVNKRFCEIFGYTEKEIMSSLKPIDIILEDDRPNAIKKNKDLLSGKKDITRYLAKGNHKKGSKLWVEIHNTSIILDDNEVITGTILDITDRKLAEEEIRLLNEGLEKNVLLRTRELENKGEDLNDSQNALLNIVEDLNEKSLLLEESAEKLENVNKELKAFTYSVSHDLKAPLRGIDGYSKLLLELYSNNLNKEAQTFLNNIHTGTLQMNQLIDDLLAYSRLERSSIRETEIDLKKVIDDILANYREEIDTRKIQININIKNTIVFTDYNGLTMALRNLIENAIKFTKSVISPIINISFTQSESDWEISVKDNGIGFKMDYHDRIFEIFHRLHHVEDYPGTGIGLALVKKAIKRMGGSVRAESELNSGAVFYIKFQKKLHL